MAQLFSPLFNGWIDSTKNLPILWFTKTPCLQNTMSESRSWFSIRPDLLRLMSSREMRRLQNPLGMYAILYLLLMHSTGSVATGYRPGEPAAGRKYFFSSPVLIRVNGLSTDNIEGMRYWPLPNERAISYLSNNCRHSLIKLQGNRWLPLKIRGISLVFRMPLIVYPCFCGTVMICAKKLANQIGSMK